MSTPSRLLDPSVDLLPLPELRSLLEDAYYNQSARKAAEQQATMRKSAFVEIASRADLEGRKMLASEAREAAAHNTAYSAIRDALGRPSREEESAALRMRLPHVFSGSQPAKPSVGVELQRAIEEVRGGRNVAHVDLEDRGLTEGGPAGVGVPIEIADPVHTLRAKSVVMGLPGVRTVSMASDRQRFPRIGANTATGVAEAATMSENTADVDLVDLVAVKFGVYSLLSTEVEEDFSADALNVFGINQLEALARRVDYGFLEGVGASDVVGLRNIDGVNSTSVAAKPADFDKWADALYEAAADNASPTVWIGHPRTWKTLSQIKTGISSDKSTLLEPNPQDAAKTLLGLPVFLSSQITLTEGATSVGSWMAALDTSQIVIGIRRPARLEVSRDFKFDSDQLAVRSTTRVAFAALNPEGISLLTDIRDA